MLQITGAGEMNMTPAPELVECANCDCWFAGASLDDVFFHATARCCREKGPAPAVPPVTER